MDSLTGVRSHEIVVPRTARYAELGADGSAVDELWLACHGYGQLASRFIRRFGVIGNGSRLIVAPEALSRFYVVGATGPHSAADKVGASWMTREERDAEIRDQVTYLDLVLAEVLERPLLSPKRVVGFGFSQGGATVCRWAVRARRPPDHLVLWGSGIPVDLLSGQARDRLARISLTLVVGARDPLAAGEELASHREELSVAGLPHRFVRYDGGHEIDDVALREIAEA